MKQAGNKSAGGGGRHAGDDHRDRDELGGAGEHEHGHRPHLDRAQPGLDGRIPLDLIDNAAGTEAVILLLEQIYHGLVP